MPEQNGQSSSFNYYRAANRFEALLGCGCGSSAGIRRALYSRVERLPLDLGLKWDSEVSARVIGSLGAERTHVTECDTTSQSIAALPLPLHILLLHICPFPAFAEATPSAASVLEAPLLLLSLTCHHRRPLSRPICVDNPAFSIRFLMAAPKRRPSTISRNSVTTS